MIRYPSQAAWVLVWSVCLAVCTAESARAQADNHVRDVVRDRTSSQGAAGRRWAVIIAVDEYDDARIPDLRFCAADAQLVTSVLTQECGYDPRDVVLLATGGASGASAPTLDNLRDELRFLIRKARGDDVVLVFFSGHGYLNADGAGFLLPQDCDRDAIEAKSLPTGQLREWLNQCPARSKLLVLDCCHAGGKDAQAGPTGEELGREFRDSPGLLTLASCRAGERSWEWQVKRQGLFTHYLTQGLQGEADLQNDGLVDSAELYSYVRGRVVQTAAEELKASQTPVQVAVGEVPVFALARVTPKVFFEDFAKIQPGLLPEGWDGPGLSVQQIGTRRVLQLREIGSGSVTLPPQKIVKDFYLECLFHTHGYVNKRRKLDLLLAGKDRTPRITVSLTDCYPNLTVTVNGRSVRIPPGEAREHRLVVKRMGKSLQVQFNDTPVDARQVDVVALPLVQLALANERDEYGRADQNSFPTVYSIRIGPLTSGPE